MNRNIPLLAICLCLMMSGSSLIITSAALVGASLAPTPSLATLPLACFFIATMSTALPAGWLMEKIGRKTALIFSTLSGGGGSLLAGYSIQHALFPGFVIGIVLIGIFNGFGNFFRFTAADSVETHLKSKAISRVMIGGVFAAFLGPGLASITHLWMPEAEFAATFFAASLLYAGIALSLSFIIQGHPAPSVSGLSTAAGRPLGQIVMQPRFLVAIVCGMLGYSVMTFVMTATPLAMQQHQHAFEITAIVIQWHVLAMFLPSFFTGNLIARFGLVPVMLCGVMLGFACVATNLLGTTQLHFQVALICLGLSWSFLFIGATTLLTSVYTDEEKHRVQGLNDFLVFSAVATASLSAGLLHDAYGWRLVNIGVLPLLVIILLSLGMLFLQERTEGSDDRLRRGEVT